MIAAQQAEARSKLAKLKSRSLEIVAVRQGMHADRIASAWLIRRFIDPDARLKFVRRTDYTPAPEELRFDMFKDELTHEGGHCTFEVLLC
jgi:hypothetical protein